MKKKLEEVEVEVVVIVVVEEDSRPSRNPVRYKLFPP